MRIDSDEKRKWWVLGQVEVYADLVMRGKPAASLMVPRSVLDDARETAVEAGCHVHGTGKAESEWAVLWLYSRPFMREVIEALLAFAPQLPPAVLCWYEGALYGYGLDQIEAGCSRLPLCEDGEPKSTDHSA